MRSLIGLSLILVLALITYGVYVGQDASRGLVLTYGKAQPSGEVVEFSPLPAGVDWTGWVVAAAFVGIMFLIRHYRHQTELPKAQRRSYDC